MEAPEARRGTERELAFGDVSLEQADKQWEVDRFSVTSWGPCLLESDFPGSLESVTPSSLWMGREEQLCGWGSMGGAGYYCKPRRLVEHGDNQSLA